MWVRPERGRTADDTRRVRNRECAAQVARILNGPVRDESSSALGLAFAHDLKDCLHLAAERSKSLTSASPANDDQRQPRSEAARRLRTGRVLMLSHQQMTQLLKAASGKGKHFHGRGI